MGKDKMFAISDKGIRFITQMYGKLCDANALYNRYVTGGSKEIPEGRRKIIQELSEMDAKWKSNLNDEVFKCGAFIISGAIA